MPPPAKWWVGAQSGSFARGNPRGKLVPRVPIAPAFATLRLIVTAKDCI
jgi:hypothetical protein